MSKFREWAITHTNNACHLLEFVNDRSQHWRIKYQREYSLLQDHSLFDFTSKQGWPHDIIGNGSGLEKYGYRAFGWMIRNE